MADDNLRPDATPDYEETVAPENPPRSIVNPKSRSTWLASSVGTIIAILVVAAAVFAFVLLTGDKDDKRQRTDPQAIGTSGDRTPRDATPGGFNPTPRPKDTRSELEFRGSDLAETGHTMHFDGRTVERAEGNTFWIRQDGKLIEVVAPGGMPTVKAGQKVDVDGRLEGGGDSPRLTASRIEVK
jgi:hypothetical protein